MKLWTGLGLFAVGVGGALLLEQSVRKTLGHQAAAPPVPRPPGAPAPTTPSRPGAFSPVSPLLAAAVVAPEFPGTLSPFYQPLAPRETMFVAALPGLPAYETPSVASRVVGTIPFNQAVQVLSAARGLPAGWLAVNMPDGSLAYVCNTCSDIPGGPWLSLSSNPSAKTLPAIRLPAV